MKWTGFTKDIPDTNTSFRSSKREELGGLSTVKMTDRIGNDEIIIKTFAERYQKVIYNKTSKEEGGNLVCVFVGDNRTPFSEYTTGDLIEKTIHYWGVEPETDLSKLFEKKLLVLPCPVRVLTASETATIKKFLAGERRLVLFSGTDTTIANLKAAVIETGNTSVFFPWRILQYVWSHYSEPVGVVDREASWLDWSAS
jgi:hypothetical protein